MTWVGITVGVGLLLVVAVAVLVRRRPRGDVDAHVDPLFTTGIVLTGAGVALATTLGPAGYGTMIAGLASMGLGAYRTRHHRHG